MANDVSLILMEVARLDAKMDESLKDMSLSREQLNNLKEFKDSIKMFINKIRDSEKDLTKLINSDSMTVKELGNRFSALMDLLDLTDKKTGSLVQILNHISSFKSSKRDFERVIKTVQMRLRHSGSDRDTFLAWLTFCWKTQKSTKSLLTIM